ncbi:intraflagellar transport 54 [Leptinotarsa decemlineata]|uniref:intraflagellar transport 54 n=1 Tax=Leptinotarsa decemlineata TaxID=7539 RepID=UPI003D3050CE
MSEEITTETIKKTQKSLGKYVKKPSLTEKLLRKPPFRFLHDIIHTVVKETGYLVGLFTEEELSSENVKDKDSKINFLDKLIDAVRTTTQTKLTVRSSKIVAGLEPTNTNLLLQAIAKAIDNKIDTSSYVNQLKSAKENKKSDALKEGKSKTGSKEKNVKNKETDSKSSKRGKSGDEIPKQKKTIDETLKSKKTGSESLKNKKVSSSRDSSRNKVSSRTKIGTESPQKVVESENVAMNEILQNGQNNKKVDNEELTESNIYDTTKEGDILVQPQPQESSNENAGERSTTEIIENDKTSLRTEENLKNIRPKSARPKSGEKKSISVIKTDSIDKDHNQNVDTIAGNIIRPKSSLRPPSVRPSSSRPGAPRLRPESVLPLQETVTMGNINVIVEKVDLMDDEETVVIETTTEMPRETLRNLDISGDNKGQLVEQILEQIQEEEGSKKKVDIDWDADALHSEDSAYKEVNQLRTYIQNLTKTANPLGKLLNYLHEDIDAMHGELQMWLNSKKQLSEEIQKQKKINVEANKPLLIHLDQLRQEINKVKQEIITAQSNISRNDIRIQELLSK